MNKRRKTLGIIATALLILLLVYVFLSGSVFVFYSVKTADMAPTLLEGDTVYVSRTAYRNSSPQRGDIVLFAVEGTSGEDLLRRVIGMPGDLVQIRDGNIYINDVLIQENYLAEVPTYPSQGYEYSTVVPENCYFVLCDNRAHEEDSRNPEIGFVSILSIKGRATKIIASGDRNTDLTSGENTNES